MPYHRSPAPLARALPALALLGLATSCHAFHEVRTTGKAGFVARSDSFLGLVITEEILWCEPPQPHRSYPVCYPTGEAIPGQAGAQPAAGLPRTSTAPRACESDADCVAGEKCEAGSIGWKHCAGAKPAP